ncbi:iron-sulfur cluster biosynthesis family protein [Gottschalkia purinilytica]|nr:iron-sulfur cluster biosynthesis family protein [Gottschalkia purinilytica]
MNINLTDSARQELKNMLQNNTKGARIYLSGFG